LSGTSIIHYQATAADVGKGEGGPGSPPLILVEKRRNHSRRKSPQDKQKNLPSPPEMFFIAYNLFCVSVKLLKLKTEGQTI